MTSIQIKLKSTGLLTFAPERVAYRMFADGIADLMENAEILRASDENEESEIRMTIRALITQRLQTPHGKAAAYEERWSRMELEIEKVLNEEYFPKHPTPAHDTTIYEWFKVEHPELASSYKTVERRLRSIRAKGGIETDGNGNYWSKKTAIPA